MCLCVWERRGSGFRKQASTDERLKALLAPAVKTGQRVAKLLQWQHIFHLHKTSEKMEFIENKTERRGKCQSCKTKGKSAHALEDVDALESNDTGDGKCRCGAPTPAGKSPCQQKISLFAMPTSGAF
jgi:hypothetical protein